MSARTSVVDVAFRATTDVRDDLRRRRVVHRDCGEGILALQRGERGGEAGDERWEGGEVNEREARRGRG